MFSIDRYWPKFLRQCVVFARLSLPRLLGQETDEGVIPRSLLPSSEIDRGAPRIHPSQSIPCVVLWPRGSAAPPPPLLRRPRCCLRFPRERKLKRYLRPGGERERGRARTGQAAAAMALLVRPLVRRWFVSPRASPVVCEWADGCREGGSGRRYSYSSSSLPLPEEGGKSGRDISEREREREREALACPSCRSDLVRSVHDE